MQFWVRNLESGSELRLDAAPGWAQSWAPDGRNLSFTVEGGTVAVTSTDRTGEPDTLLEIPGRAVANGDWAPDGERFLFAMGGDIWWTAVGGTPQPFIVTESGARNPRFSPNGRWVAYVSDQTGERRVFLQPFPEGGAPVPVSPGPGIEPVWSSDGRELYYRSEASVVAVSIAPWKVRAALLKWIPARAAAEEMENIPGNAPVVPTASAWNGRAMRA